MSERIRDLEDVSAFTLTDEERDRLFEVKGECIVCWTNRDGWPVGMPHLFVWDGGTFWVTMTTSRKRVRALRDRPQSCIVVSGRGTELGSAMVTVKTLATVHHDAALLEWFLPLFLDRSGLPPGDESRQQQFDLMNSPGRVVVEFEPVEQFTYDSRKLNEAVTASGWAGWQRPT